MPVRTSAGLLPYRVRADVLQVLVGHMGGPFWARKDEAAWSLIKGEYDPDEEEPVAAARREWTEETGLPAPDGELLALGDVRQSSKRVIAWAAQMPDLDPARMTSQTFTIEWPPRSGRTQSFPEIDRTGWFDAPTARVKLVKGQRAFVDRLEQALAQA